MKWIAQISSFLLSETVFWLICQHVNHIEREILNFSFASIVNLYFSNTWGGRPPYLTSPTDAGNVRVQMEAGFCPSSVSWIQITFPPVISFECHRFSFGPVQLIRPRKLVALWSFSLYCTVAKKSAVSLLPLESLWGALQLQAPYALYFSVCLCVMPSAKWFTLWLESNSLIKMQLFNKAEMKHLDLMKTMFCYFARGSLGRRWTASQLLSQYLGGEGGKDLPKWPEHYFLCFDGQNWRQCQNTKLQIREDHISI